MFENLNISLTRKPVAWNTASFGMGFTHSEVIVSESQPTTVVRSVSGAEITTIAHFNCPSCGGKLDILFPNSSRLNKREVRNRLRAEEQWCDAGQRCDWHGKLPSQSLRKLRLSYGEWVKSVVA